MKKINKKVGGVLMVVVTVAIIGTIFANAQTNNNSNTTQPTMFSGRRHMNGPPSFCFNTTNTTCPQFRMEKTQMQRLRPFGFNLTEEQNAELNTTISQLQEQGASPQEIRKTVQKKLENFGVYDTILEKEISQTEQRLSILNREKELRAEGYNWTEINDKIQQEFGISTPFQGNQNMRPPFGFDRREFRMPNENK